MLSQSKNNFGVGPHRLYIPCIKNLGVRARRARDLFDFLTSLPEKSTLKKWQHFRNFCILVEISAEISKLARAQKLGVCRYLWPKYEPCTMKTHRAIVFYFWFFFFRSRQAASEVFCEKCGYTEKVLFENDKTSYKETPREISYFAYKSVNFGHKSVHSDIKVVILVIKCQIGKYKSVNSEPTIVCPE